MAYIIYKNNTDFISYDNIKYETEDRARLQANEYTKEAIKKGKPFLHMERLLVIDEAEIESTREKMKKKKTEMIASVKKDPKIEIIADEPKPQENKKSVDDPSQELLSKEDEEKIMQLENFIKDREKRLQDFDIQKQKLEKVIQDRKRELKEFETKSRRVELRIKPSVYDELKSFGDNNGLFVNQVMDMALEFFLDYMKEK